MVVPYSAPPSPDAFVQPMWNLGMSHSTHPPTALCDYAASNLDNTGIVQETYNGLHPLVRTLDITGGLSNTLMVGEKRMELNKLGTNMEDDNQGYSVGFDEDTVRYTDTAHYPQPDHRGNPNDYSDVGGQRFGSSHVGNFAAVFADGSVHHISYSIDPTIFSQLGNIHNRTPISSSSDW